MVFLFLVLGRKFEHTAFIVYHTAMFDTCLVFCVCTFLQIRKNKTKYPYRSAIMMVICFFITMLVQLILGAGSYNYALLPSVYLLALPFAAITQDEAEQKGLKTIALIYISAMLIWVLYTILLMLDCLPPFMRSYVIWEDSRLNVFFHSNTCARGFMMGIALCLGLSTCFSKKITKMFLFLAAALMLAALVLTNSRTAILITCLMLSGIIFFMIFQQNRTRFAFAAVAALATAAILLLFSHSLSQWNSNRLIAQQSASGNAVQQDTSLQVNSQAAEQHSYRVLLAKTNSHRGNEVRQTSSVSGLCLSTATETVSETAQSSIGHSNQNSFVTDLPSLNNRTNIWNAALQLIRENPSILIWGTNSTELMIENTLVPHTHNSWLEILLRMGIIGFVLSLFFTVQTIWSSLVLLRHRRTELWKKTISIMMLCLLICSFFEPSLFFSDCSWHFTDFFFFLCLGYMIQWRKGLSINTTK